MSTRPRPVVDSPGGRKADLAAIHMGKKALGWSDEDYRAILWTVCTVKSAGELDFAGRKRFLDHLRKCGFQNAQRKGLAAALTPMQARIWSLWQQLADAGRVHDRSTKGLDAFVAARAPLGTTRWTWLNEKQQDLLIEMLKAWLAR